MCLDLTRGVTEIKRHLLLIRKAMTNLDSILKSRDIILQTKVHIVAMVFLAVMNRCENWIIKKAEWQRIDAFKLWCWRRLLRTPWTARRSNQSILKEINPEYSLKGLMLNLKLQYFGHLMWSLFIRKDPDAGKDWGQKEKGVTEGKMVGWHHQLSGHEFEQTLGDEYREAWCAAVHGVAKTWTQLSNWQQRQRRGYKMPFLSFMSLYVYKCVYIYTHSSCHSMYIYVYMCACIVHINNHLMKEFCSEEGIFEKLAQRLSKTLKNNMPGWFGGDGGYLYLSRHCCFSVLFTQTSRRHVSYRALQFSK